MLNPDYKDLLNIFIDRKVDFMVVGAYAMAAHGVVRATGDINLFVAPSSDNAQRVFGALAEFGAPLKGITAEDFSTAGVVYQIGVIPCRIDIINHIDGVSFSKGLIVYRELDGLRIPFIDRDSLIKNKRAAGRPKDLADIDLLGETH